MKASWKVLTAAVAILLIASTAVMLAQVTEKKTTTAGPADQQTKVERGEVVYISGNDIIVKMESGEIRNITVPDNARATVDGKEIGLADLKVGMKLEKTITTTSTPKTIQTVRAGTGTVVNVQPPNYATVKFEDGSVERYKIPKNQKFMIDGQAKTAFELKPGMKITATRIVTVPIVEVSQQAKVSGSAPPPPPPPPVDTPILILERTSPPMPVPAAIPAETAPAPAPAPEPKKLPKTGSVLPLVGLLGLLCSGASLGIRMLRRS